MRRKKSSKPVRPKKSGQDRTAVVYVSLKEGVLDPQGQTIKKALEDLGYQNVKEVRSGKFFQLTLNGVPASELKPLVSEIADKLLANPVIEKFEVELVK